MIDLVARQIQILRAIIEEFIETGEPVGSETVDKKYNIGVSPATIRNEMAYLTKQGYLIKSHISAGRVPTALAMKNYLWLMRLELKKKFGVIVIKWKICFRKQLRF